MYPAHNAKSFTCIISFNPWNNIACMGRINPHFKDKDTEAQEHSLSKILHHLVSVLVAVSSLASPGEAFPGLK